MMHLTFGRKARFMASIMSTSNVVIFLKDTNVCSYTFKSREKKQKNETKEFQFEHISFQLYF